MSQELAFKLEAHIVDASLGLTRAPPEAIECYLKSVKERVPTAFSRYENKWYVICTAGQGPMIAWQENEV